MDKFHNFVACWHKSGYYVMAAAAAGFIYIFHTGTGKACPPPPPPQELPLCLLPMWTLPEIWKICSLPELSYNPKFWCLEISGSKCRDYTARKMLQLRIVCLCVRFIRTSFILNDS